MESFILSPHNTPLLVKAGGLHLFYQDIKTAKLHPLIEIVEGQVAFGFSENIDAEKIQIIAQPLPQSEIEIVSSDALSKSQRLAWLSAWVEKFLSLSDRQAQVKDESTVLAFNRQVFLCCLAEHQAHPEKFKQHLEHAKLGKSSALDRVQQLMDQSFDLSTNHLDEQVDVQENDAIKALVIVADYVNVKINFAGTKLKKTDTYFSYLQRTCQISGIHMRSLKLTGKWWQQCTDPLIVFTEDHAPMAVIPTAGGAMRICYCCNGEAY